MMATYDPIAILTDSGGKQDADIDLLRVSLAFAAPAHEGISIDRYINHVSKVSKDVGKRHADLIAAGAVDNVQTQLAALKHILCDQEGYVGDETDYNDLQNADLMRVIDRRQGMPISLCILYIYVGRMQGWEISGLNFPGHFLCRIEKDGVRVIFDPYHRCEVMDAASMRGLVKKLRGPQAELSVDYYQPAGNKETLIRLQNNVKLRLIEAEEYEEALQTVEMMRLLAPEEYRLLLDAGVLYAKTRREAQAVEVLERYVALAPDPRDRYDAELILSELLKR